MSMMIVSHESFNLKFAITVVGNISALQHLAGPSHAVFSPAIFPFPPVIFGRTLFGAGTLLHVVLQDPLFFSTQLRFSPRLT